MTGRALVGFSDETRLKRLLPLARGFRHCFVLVERPDRTVLIDPLSDRLIVESFAEIGLDEAAAQWRAAGFTVVPASIRDPARPAPAAPMSCVEVVKRVLGIHARHVVTPHQLYRLLLRETTAENMMASEKIP
ncbi:MAG: hypothetical protein ACK4QW_17510 [Alphaproteobacteria bacterium]